LLYDDLGKNIGALCLRNIREKSRGDKSAAIVVHPGPGEYHFDIMVPWEYQGVERGVFFTSYRLDIIARLLEVGQTEQHKLIITKNNDPELIEVTADGGRDSIRKSREIRLTESDIKRIAYSQWLEGTDWVLRDMYDENLMSDYQLRLWRPLIGAWIVVLLLVGVSLYFIRQSEVEFRVLNESVDGLVEERTADLIATVREFEEKESSSRNE